MAIVLGMLLFVVGAAICIALTWAFLVVLFTLADG